MRSLLIRCVFTFFALMSLSVVAEAKSDKHKPRPNDTIQLREQYLAKVQQRGIITPDERTLGSLWSTQNSLGDMATDYKAHRLNDTVTIQVSVQTNAAQSGAVNTSRAFSTNSALTGILGQSPAAANPLFAGNSTTALKGSGQATSNTSFSTSLTGQIIAVLPGGNLVLEAEREVFMNNQHEHIVIRGIIRSGDIGPSNTVPSTSLSHLEIEMKGKGIISDGVRPLNPITRAVLWLFGF